MESLLTRCEHVWEMMGLDANKRYVLASTMIIDNSKEHPQITDEMIRAQTTVRLIFSGLGDALLQYVCWEKSQY